MTPQRETQQRWRAEGRCIICGDPAVTSNPRSKRKSKDGLSPYCQTHLDAMNERARTRNAARRIRKPPVRYVETKLMMRMLNSHLKNCKPERPGWRWKVDDDNVHELIPFHRRSYFGDRRGDGYRFILLRCNSTLGCRATAFVRLEDIELAAEGILEQ